MFYQAVKHLRSHSSIANNVNHTLCIRRNKVPTIPVPKCLTSVTNVDASASAVKELKMDIKMLQNKNEQLNQKLIDLRADLTKLSFNNTKPSCNCSDGYNRYEFSDVKLLNSNYHV